jgi:hypothetical protein
MKKASKQYSSSSGGGGSGTGGASGSGSTGTATSSTSSLTAAAAAASHLSHNTPLNTHSHHSVMGPLSSSLVLPSSSSMGVSPGGSGASLGQGLGSPVSSILPPPPSLMYGGPLPPITSPGDNISNLSHASSPLGGGGGSLGGSLSLGLSHAPLGARSSHGSLPGSLQGSISPTSHLQNVVTTTI